MSSRVSSLAYSCASASLFTFAESASAQRCDWTVCVRKRDLALPGIPGSPSALRRHRVGDHKYVDARHRLYHMRVSRSGCTRQLPCEYDRVPVRTATATVVTGVSARRKGQLRVYGAQEVRFGANGSYYYKTLTAGRRAPMRHSATPLRCRARNCSLRTASDWNFCASEGSYLRICRHQTGPLRRQRLLFL